MQDSLAAKLAIDGVIPTAVPLRVIATLVCFAMIMLGGTRLAMSAPPTGTIDGVVKDAQGRPLPGVQLTLRAATGRAGAERVRSLYSVEAMCEATLKVYADLVRSRT